MHINPGDLRHKVEIIDSPRMTYDTDGFPTDSTPVVVWSGWARITNVSGTEIIKSGESFADVRKRFFIRTPKANISEEMKVRWNGEVHEITYINNYSEDRTYTEIWTQKTEAK